MELIVDDITNSQKEIKDDPVSSAQLQIESDPKNQMAEQGLTQMINGRQGQGKRQNPKSLIGKGSHHAFDSKKNT